MRLQPAASVRVGSTRPAGVETTMSTWPRAACASAAILVPVPGSPASPRGRSLGSVAVAQVGGDRGQAVRPAGPDRQPAFRGAQNDARPSLDDAPPTSAVRPVSQGPISSSWLRGSVGSVMGSVEPAGRVRSPARTARSPGRSRAVDTASARRGSPVERSAQPARPGVGEGAAPPELLGWRS